MVENKIKGNVTELECITACVKLGLVVSIPYGEDSRYDFIVDYNGKLLRIQCKTSSEIIDSGEVSAIVIKTCRQGGDSAHGWTRVQYSKEEIDFFATSYNGKCYIIPVEECSNEKRLRFIPPKNGQKTRINFAKDYELEEVLKRV